MSSFLVCKFSIFFYLFLFDFMEVSKEKCGIQCEIVLLVSFICLKDIIGDDRGHN